MSTFDPAAYGPAIEKLLRPPRLPALAVDTPPTPMRAQLKALQTDEAFAPFRIRNRSMADACRAGLWLLFDFLDEAHGISQELDTPEGSYWHAIVHRREPDANNAKYWYRKVGTHAIFEPLRQRAAQLAGERPPQQAVFLARQAAWDPIAFVDLCAAFLAGAAPCEDLCRHIQRAEWDLLFDYCHQKAVDSNR